MILVAEHIRERMGIKGAMILDVQRNSAADLAGLKATRRDYFGEVIYGDIIVSVDDNAITNNEELVLFFEKKKEGEKVNIKFMRGRKEYGTTVILQEL